LINLVGELVINQAMLTQRMSEAELKSVRLTTEGEKERLADPLTHMIRNAIDHGVETPEQRAAVGKPEEGLVHLSALHRSGRIVIEVADDGAGIDRARVKSLASAKGLIASEAQLSDEEIDNNAEIYFDDPTREQHWGCFAPKLSPGGALHVGHSERVTGEAAQMFGGEGATIYRLRRGRRA
jgi:chemotaxis protein histidine kinase CheA